MRVPAKIETTIKTDGQEMKGVSVMLKFLTARKNPYDLVFGPSDEQGRIVVMRDQIIGEARKTLELFLMDYGDLEIEWTGKLRVTPMNRKSIERALLALRCLAVSMNTLLGTRTRLRQPIPFWLKRARLT